MRTSIYQWIICSFMLLFTQILFAQNNIKENKYDLNDPRNPDCPCHKLQKQAEEEYARQHQQVIPASNNNPVQTGNLKIENTATESRVKQLFVFCKNKKKNRFVKINSLKFRIAKKMNSVKKCRPDYSVCYKW